MNWNRNINDIPPRTEVLVLTDLGEVRIAMRPRKNGRYLDVKTVVNGKIEWLKNELDLRKWGNMPYCPVVYWSRIDNLTKKQYNAVFAPNPRWDRMFEL